MAWLRDSVTPKVQWNLIPKNGSDEIHFGFRSFGSADDVATWVAMLATRVAMLATRVVMLATRVVMRPRLITDLRTDDQAIVYTVYK
jgi:hypothetical protein